MALWLTRMFPQIEELVGFVNGQDLSATQFKVVSGRDARGAPGFHLIYTEDGPLPAPEQRMVEADLLPVLGEGESGDAGEAVEQAEAIIQAHDGDETPTS